MYIRFVETNTSWSGVLRFGFTSVDPATVRGSDLPRYACPDLTNKPGNWAKALGERYTTNNILLFFYTTRSGDVYYGVNGEEKGLFFSGVNTSGPLWAMLDIYGNTVGVEFTQPNGSKFVMIFIFLFLLLGYLAFWTCFWSCCFCLFFSSSSCSLSAEFFFFFCFIF